MDKVLIMRLQELCVQLKEDEQEARHLKQERPEDAAYFAGLEVGRMQARIAMEALIEKRTGSSFSCPSRAVTLEG